VCLILLAWQQHRDYPLVLAANRDEYYSRPTAPARPWQDQPGIIGGRDLLQGGSWLAMGPNGRFAVVTNFREPPPAVDPPLSRGRLVSDFLLEESDPAEYLAGVEQQGKLYRGFSLLVGDRSTVGYLSNRVSGYRLLEPGLYGVSNALLDTPWPKVVAGKAGLASQLTSSTLDSTGLFDLLADESLPELPEGISANGDLLAGAQAPIFIRTAEYGTRCSTLLWAERAGGMTLLERSFEPSSRRWSDVCHRFGDS
jgi:uncharacterized protein with NRDE domain